MVFGWKEPKGRRIIVVPAPKRFSKGLWWKGKYIKGYKNRVSEKGQRWGIKIYIIEAPGRSKADRSLNLDL